MAWHSSYSLGSVKCLEHAAFRLWRTCHTRAPGTCLFLCPECSFAALGSPRPTPFPSTWLLPPHLRRCCCRAAFPRAALSNRSEYKPQTGATCIILNFLIARWKGLKDKKSYYLQSFFNLTYQSCFLIKSFEIQCVFSTWGTSPFWPMSGATTLDSTGLDPLLSPSVTGAVCVYSFSSTPGIDVSSLAEWWANTYIIMPFFPFTNIRSL